MGLLSLIGSGDLASTDGPHGLVGNDDVLPILLLEHVDHSLELSLADVHGLTALSLLEQLTNAQDDLDAVGKSDLGLLGNQLVRLSSDGVAALAVAHEGPVNTEVYSIIPRRKTPTLQHRSRELTSVGTISLFIISIITKPYVDLPDVLSSNLNLRSHESLDKANVHSSGSDHNITVTLDLTSSVEGVDKISEGSLSSVLCIRHIGSEHLRTSSFHQ